MDIVRPSSRVVVSLAALLVAGCQSGVERDIVQRELRQQEDQIYALEDYLSEYQQLLCDARSENAMLKQQVVQGQFRDSESNGSSDSILPSPADEPQAPRSTTPETAPPGVPPLDLNQPTVPPLDATSAEESPGDAGEIKLAVAEVTTAPRPASAVVLRGEVRLDDAENGPRVLVEVEPVADAGQPAEFHGNLSLLVLDPAARSDQKQLARWDFASADLSTYTKAATNGLLYEFPLQLPPEVPSGRSVELWVRLVPEEGEKLLARTTMDLSRSGCFASAEAPPRAAVRKEVRTASLERPAKRRRPQTIRKSDPNIEQSGWHTARPGEVVKGKPAGAKSTTEWRTATQPIPVAESTSIVDSPDRKPMPEGDRYGGAAAPEWTPNRSGSDAAKTPSADYLIPPTGPTWAPTR